MEMKVPWPKVVGILAATVKKLCGAHHYMWYAMIEWTATGKKEPIYVQVTWTDAASDNTFACTLAEVGKRATLMHKRQSDGRFVYVSTEGREAKVVLASLYDAPDTPDDDAMVENFMVIPWGWVEQIRVIRGPVIYMRDVPETPRALKRTRRRAPPAQ